MDQKIYPYNQNGFKELEIFVLSNLASEDIIHIQSISKLNNAIALRFSVLEERIRHMLLFLQKGYWHPKEESDKKYFNGHFSGLGSVLIEIEKHPDVKSYKKSEVILEHLRMANRARNSLFHSFAYVNLYHYSNIGHEIYEKEKIDYAKLMKSIKALHEFHAVLKSMEKFDILFFLTGRKYKELKMEDKKIAQKEFAKANDFKYTNDERFFSLLDKFMSSLREFNKKYKADLDK